MAKKWMTTTEVCDQLRISESTWEKWRAKGLAPHAVKLPNGKLRIDAVEFDAWVDGLEVA